METPMTLLTRARELAGPDSWQPIETAPKDGGWILVCRGNNHGVVEWDRNNEHWRIGPFLYFDRPSYWMPLPEPPAALNPQETTP